MVICAICEREVLPENSYDVISARGITKVCNHCYSEDMPAFNKPSKDDFDSVYKRKSVYNRLSESAGIDSEEHRRKISNFKAIPGNSKDESLRRIANRNFEMHAKQTPKEENLIDNFHWIITRERRFKKLSQKQFAAEIGEPESAIVLAERGFIPAGSRMFIQKIEEALRIRISKSPVEKEMSPFEKIQKEYIDKIKEEGNFDPIITRNVTTSDLVADKKKGWRFFGRKKKKESDADLIEDVEDLT